MKCGHLVQRYAATHAGQLLGQRRCEQHSNAGTAEYYRENAIMLDGSSQKWDK